MGNSPHPTDAQELRSLTIGALARLTKTNPSIIRIYEDLGLLPPPFRPEQSASPDAVGARVYGDSDVRRLLFLRRVRDLGLLNPALKLLMELVDDPANVSKLARESASVLLGNVRDQLHELSELEKVLDALLAGKGPSALALAGIDMTPISNVKRMRRLLRKPLKTPGTS